MPQKSWEILVLATCKIGEMLGMSQSRFLHSNQSFDFEYPLILTRFPIHKIYIYIYYVLEVHFMQMKSTQENPRGSVCRPTPRGPSVTDLHQEGHLEISMLEALQCKTIFVLGTVINEESWVFNTGQIRRKSQMLLTYDKYVQLWLRFEKGYG